MMRDALPQIDIPATLERKDASAVLRPCAEVVQGELDRPQWTRFTHHFVPLIAPIDAFHDIEDGPGVVGVDATGKKADI